MHDRRDRRGRAPLPALAGVKVVAAFDSFKGSLTSRQAGEAAALGVRDAVPGAEVVVDTSVPLRASSYGLGLQLAAALASGAPRVLVGLGGSATTDGGTGLLAALGAVLQTRSGDVAHGNLLPDVLSVEDLPDLSRVEVLTDVTSPLLGPTGAAQLFGPQKGADEAQVALLEAQLERWASLLASAAGRPVAEVVSTPGAGAAGGIGAALLACGARLVPGFAHVASLVGLEDALAGADLVLTGEGSFDAQSALGKGPVGVADLARGAGVPVVVLAGRVAHPLGVVAGRVDAAFGIHPRALPLVEALDPLTAAAHLRMTAGEVARLVARLR